MKVSFLEIVQNGAVSSDMRFLLLKWLYTLGEKYNLNVATIQKSITYVDIFLSHAPATIDVL